MVRRSKPAMFWHVKTSRHRELPIIAELRPVFERALAGRGEGFVFLNRPFATGAQTAPMAFASPQAFARHLQELTEQERLAGAKQESALRKAVMPFLRRMGQIPEKRLRQEFMKITSAIGCPEITKVHGLRHVFSTRAQELGLNPILVQEVLGHSTLAMPQRYTHLGMEAKRKGLRGIVTGFVPALETA